MPPLKTIDMGQRSLVEYHLELFYDRDFLKFSVLLPASMGDRIEGVTYDSRGEHRLPFDVVGRVMATHSINCPATDQRELRVYVKFFQVIPGRPTHGALTPVNVPLSAYHSREQIIERELRAEYGNDY